MASGDFVTSAKVKVREADVGVNRPNSEAVNQKLSGSINGLIDSSFYEIDEQRNGYFGNSQIYRGAPIRIEKISDIIFYQLSLLDTGSSGSNVFNFAIYDDSGAFVNNLFGTGANRSLISGSNGANVLIGRNIDSATTFNTNTAGHTIQYGNLSVTTLLAGYILVPFVETFATSARSIRFRMKLREQ